MAANENLVHLTDANFKDVIGGDKPVLVDFYTDWCGPCKMLAPIIAELAEEFKDRAIVAKLNAEDNPATSEEYGVFHVPTVYVFKKGETLVKNEGYAGKDKLKNMLLEAIK
ncbi:MAG: thioredoxin [Clostridiales bacterium]|jgi:thioredoxin 1|nr:thioredoxin [Clostridiales bacterium]